MASAQWLLNDTSVNNGSFFTAESGSSYKLKNTYGATRNRVTSSPTPYEGAGCYASGLSNEVTLRIQNSSSADLSGSSGTYYFDAYVYVKSGSTDALNPFVVGNDTAVEYSWIELGADTSLWFGGYDTVYGVTATNQTATGKFSTNTWFRVQSKTNQYGVNTFRVFVGSNINQTTPDTTVTAVDFGATYGHTTFEYITALNGNASTNPLYMDNIKFDDAGYPARPVAYTADASSTITATGTSTVTKTQTLAASSTITATGTSAVSKNQPLDASATITASGTSAASNARVIDASSTVTASGTSVANNARVLDASATVTASGTSTASVAAVITMDASSTITASATSNATSTQLINASATITASGTSTASIRPIVTIDASSTVTASATSTLSRGQSLSGSATTTASAASTIIGIITISGSATVTASASADVLVLTKGSLYSEVKTSASLYGKQSSTLLTN